jgi:gliding motility-associated-like protein
MKKHLPILLIIVSLFLVITGVWARPDKTVNPILFKISHQAETATPQLIIGEVTGAISACAGTASASPAIQQFTVSASGLSADVLVTAPADFEVSLTADGAFSASVMLMQTSGLISSQVIYVRSSAQAAVGNISGDVALTSGDVTQTARVTGHINPLPLVSPIPDQTLQNGQLTMGVIFTGTARIFNWTNDNTSIGLAASGNQGIPSFTAVNTGAAPVTAHITVTPAPASYAYAANSPGNSVSLINTITGNTEQVITEGMPANSSPQRLLFSPDKSLLYVENEGSHSIAVINTVTNKVVTTFPAGFDPVGMVISPDGSKLYITDGSTNQLTTFSTADYSVIKTVTTGDIPYDLTISADGKKLYIINAGSNIVQFYDTATGYFEYAIITGTTPNSIIISPDNKTLYVANYNSHDVAVIDIAARRILYKIDVGTAANCLAISPDGARLYVSLINDKKVIVINTLTRSIVTPIDVGQNPAGITTNSDGSKVYVVNSLSPYISVINAATNAVTQQIPVQSGGRFMAILSDNECPGLPVQFAITVNPSAVPVDISIPNSFSPNGDGSNDLWAIAGLSAYPQNTVEVFNRYGQRIFRSAGYSTSWDGTFNGHPVPPATYYYIVNLKNGKKALSGSVTVVK